MALPAAGLESRNALPADTAGERHQLFFLQFLLVVSIGLLLLPPLTSSLWLDETYVWRWIKDGYFEALDRIHLPSAAYVTLVWAVKEVLGNQEWALRLPSVVAAIVTVCLLVHLGATLRDRETGLLAAIVLATQWTFIFSAADMRPYSLALLATLGAFCALVGWLRTGRRSFALAYVVLASAIIYLHVLLAVVFLVHGLFVWRERSRGPWITVRTVCGIAGLTGLLALPFAAETVRLAGRRELVSFAGPPSISALAEASVSPILVLGLWIGVAVAAVVDGPLNMRWRRAQSEDLIFFSAWALVPPVVLFVAAFAASATLFVPRYTICAAPGLALLAAYLVRSIEPPRARRIIIQVLVALSVASFFSRRHGDEDWRAAVAAAREITTGKSTPVLLRSGMIESRDPRWLVDREKRDLTLAPLTYYRLDADVIPLPWDLDSQPEREYMERVVTDRLLSADRFVLIARNFADNGTFAAWLRGRLGPSGFCDHSLGDFGAVDARVFERGTGACGDAVTR